MLTFTMTTEQAQIMLNALIQQPYATVAELIATIQQQAAEQMQPARQASSPTVSNKGGTVDKKDKKE